MHCCVNSDKTLPQRKCVALLCISPMRSAFHTICWHLLSNDFLYDLKCKCVQHLSSLVLPKCVFVSEQCKVVCRTGIIEPVKKLHFGMWQEIPIFLCPKFWGKSLSELLVESPWEICSPYHAILTIAISNFLGTVKSWVGLKIMWKNLCVTLLRKL